MVIPILVLAETASGYNWNVGPPGPNFNYHVCVDSFSAAEEDAIEQGADAWDAGAGEVLRGADVNVWRDTDRTLPDTCGRANGVDEVYAMPQGWMDTHFCGAFIACTWTSGFPFPDTDITFNDSEVWCTETPSHPDCAGELSIGQVMMHEIGHKIGFGHENDNLATMNSSYPDGGDMNQTKYRIHEDDSVGLQDHEGDSSTGRNLMIQRYQFVGGVAEERWVNDHTFDKSDGDWTDGHPADVQAVIEGTSSATALLQWRVEISTAAGCWDGVGTEYVVGSRTVTVGPNLPYEIGPSSWNFSGVPAGAYKLCARIDADDSITETAENDNRMRGPAILTVRP